MKKKLANLLRRWASKLSPEIILPPPAVMETRHDVQRFQCKTHYSRRELEALEHDPDLAVAIDLDKRRELLNDLALTMHQAGAIKFHTEPESCPDSRDVLVVTCYAVINPPTPTV